MTLANEIGGKHGIGIGLHLVENRFVGVKSRGIYEAPGMELLGTTYGFLLQLILDRRARELFDQLSATLTKQLYQGYWNDIASRMGRKAVAETATLVTGTVTVSLYKGVISYVNTADVPHSLFSNDGSMEAEGGSITRIRKASSACSASMLGRWRWWGNQINRKRPSPPCGRGHKNYWLTS
jgi:argininosuccinate synthase